MNRFVRSIICAALAGTAALAAGQQALPRWEAGLAAGAGWVPDYPGADRSQARAIVVPIVVYRGPVLRVDSEGVRGRLLDRGLWRFELTATAAFDAKDSPARDGMPALDYLVGIGPQWIYHGWQRDGHGPTLHLKLRSMLSADLDPLRLRSQGWTFAPELRWRVPAGGGQLTLALQPGWASRRLAARFYDVDAGQATAQRPAWAARAGYLGTDASLTLTRREGPGWSWFATVQLNSLHGAANRGSPLLRERTQFTLGTGVLWTPWRSSANVSD